MFRNYFIVAMRNILRYKISSFINIAGLTLSLACLFIVVLFVSDELSYDKWVPNIENLYRVGLTVEAPGRAPLDLAVVAFPLPPAMRDHIPEVTGMTRFMMEQMTLTAGNRQFLENINVVDPTFFQVIKLPLISGDPNSVFRHPESIVLSEAGARKYFGTTNPIGKTITTTATCSDGELPCANRTISLQVTGVLRNLPHNSQFDGDVFLPNTSAADRTSLQLKQSWFSANTYGYVRLAPGADPRTVIAGMSPILDENVTGELKRRGINRAGSRVYAIHLTPFADVHLASGKWLLNNKPAGSWITLYGVTLVGLLILLVACFNFTNLATAGALRRSREIALRKTLGASRKQLIVQFLSESVLTSLLSLVFALAAVEVCLPGLETSFLGSDILQGSFGWKSLALISLVAIGAGLVSGLYPALVLSRFKPVSLLRSGSLGQVGSGWLRTVLVVLQFAVAICFGIVAIVIFSQITFARKIDLGFRHDNIVVVSGSGLITASGRQSFVAQLRSNPAILDVAMLSPVPFDTGVTLASVKLPGQPDTVALNREVIGPGAVKLLGIRLAAGRLLSDSRAQDKTSVGENHSDPGNDQHAILINETAAARFGWTPEQAIGERIIYNGLNAKIVGVLEDAKFDGALEAAKATAYVYDPDFPTPVVIRIRQGAVPQALAYIDKAWHAFAPTKAIERYFLDESFNRLYAPSEKQGRMFATFVAITIFVACLGLFGLVAFAVAGRTKEIGIRKVFGARTRDVIFLLIWQFSLPVVIANVIAWPAAWYYLHGWLRGFAYRIALSPLYFAGASLITLLIAWTTIFTQARRAARTRPINALRHE